MSSSPDPIDIETLHDLYERAPCGYVSTRPDGTIVLANRTFRDWLGVEGLTGSNLRDHLTVGGRIFFETNYQPLLRLQGEVLDLAVELRRGDGSTLPVLISSRTIEDPVGGGPVVRSTIFDGTGRHEQERQLRAARRRAEESEAQIRSISLQLQRSMMAGSITAGPGFTVATHYRPATDDLEIGGDWYDAFWVAEREVATVVVGDVVGRGIGAACAMGQLRSALRAIALSGVGPGRTLDRLDAFAQEIPAAHTATVACAEIEPATRAVRYACAGHLPPLLIGPEGPPAYLSDGRSVPLASVPPMGPRPEGAVVLPEGSRLLLFTDGLIERRDRGLPEGFDTLARAAAELRALPPADMVDGLLAELLQGEGTPDDVCLLALDVTAPHDP